ncbi:MAG: MarR family transcriptional regulator [Actinomycetota bacterium]|nr:MarR family transcriptional regulator [Actinomycetota bacterium]
MSAEPSRPDDLHELGLTPDEAAVLHVLLRVQEATPAQICAATGITPPRASTTISGLMRLGLADRVPNRRPSVVFVNPQADAVAAQLRTKAAERRDEAGARAARAADAVHRAARQSAERRRPMYELQPGTDPLSPDYDALRRGRTSHDEVGIASPELFAWWVPSPSCATRLLLVSRDPVADHAGIARLRARAETQPRRCAVEVRSTHDARAELLLLDGDRVRVSASSAHGRVLAWSREPVHVLAAAELFELWWLAATPRLELPARSPSLPPEPDYDVEEWDPEDLDDAPPGPA